MLKKVFGTAVFVSCVVVVSTHSPVSAVSCDLDGSGTSAAPYLVASAANLTKVGTDCALNAHYRQTANITLVPPVAPATSNHTPIGSDSSRFTGVYDGGGFTISNLVVNATASDDIGLFGFTASANITDVSLVNASITGKNQVGGLIGFASLSTIERSFVSGSVTGGFSVGGLVGYNDRSSTTNAYVVATVTGNLLVGGIAGALLNGGATVTTSYFSGTVTGTSTVGWLVGEACGNNNGGPQISNSFAHSTATVTSMASQLVGDLCDGTITGSASKTSAEMKTFSVFSSADWDIADGYDNTKVWGICALANDGYPFLTMQYLSNPCITENNNTPTDNNTDAGTNTDSSTNTGTSASNNEPVAAKTTTTSTLPLTGGTTTAFQWALILLLGGILFQVFSKRARNNYSR